MPDRQPETPRTDEEFSRNLDRVLAEADAPFFEELLEQLPKLLRAESIELLHNCKARVDALIASEPDKNFVNPNDPHEIRVSYWYKIAERFEAEINFRSGKSAKATGDPKGATRGSDPEVAKRRSIVKGNPTKSAQQLCKLFHFQQVQLPREWQDKYSVKSWDEAYRNQNLRHRIQALITRDKNSTNKP